MNKKSIPILLSAILVTVVGISATNNAVAQGTWTTGAPIPIAVEGYGAAVVGTTHYYIGGYHFGDMNLVQKYDASSNTWLPNGAPMPVSEAELASVHDSGPLCSGGPCLYAVGGRTVLGLLQRYDPVANAWTTLAPMPVPVATEHSVVFHGGKIYVAGGRTSGAPGGFGAVSNLQIYDITSNTWSMGPSLPMAVSDAAAVAQDDRIFVFGGSSSGTVLGNTLIFDIASNTWSMGAPLPTARADESVGICRNLIHVIGGDSSLGLTAVHEVYDPTVNSWTSDLPIPGGTSGSGTEVQALSTSSGIFIVGGGIFGSGSGNPIQNIFSERCVNQIAVHKFFTDTSNNPLPLDSKGNPKVDVVLANGIVKSTNPGGIIAWVNVTNTAGSPVQSLKVSDTLPMDWVVAPKWLPAKGAIHVYYAITTSLSTNPEITDPTTITVTTGNPQTVLLAIPDLNATSIGHPLLAGQSILLAIKLDYGLDKTSQSVSSYPRNYTDTADATAWTGISYTGTENTGSGSGSFIAYAKLLGDVNGDNKVDIRDVAIVAYAYGSRTGNARWNPAADFDNDGVIDISDVATVAFYFGTSQ